MVTFLSCYIYALVVLILTIYLYTGYAQYKNIKLPLLLHCGHSACENCVNIELKSKKELQCKICDGISNVSAE